MAVWHDLNVMKKVKTTLRIDADIKRALADVARDSNRTEQSIVEESLRDFLDLPAKPKKKRLSELLKPKKMGAMNSKLDRKYIYEDLPRLEGRQEILK